VYSTASRSPIPGDPDRFLSQGTATQDNPLPSALFAKKKGRRNANSEVVDEEIREVLRLSAAGRSQRLIAQSIGVGQSTVGDYLNRARLAGVAWPMEMDDAALEHPLQQLLS
jgi:hypothetical protein